MSKQAGKKSVISADGNKAARKILLLMSGLLLIVAIGGYGTYYTKKALATRQCNGKSGGQLYKDSVAAIQSGSVVELRNVTRQVKKQKYYENDPSCLYPLVVQALNNKQFDEARRLQKKIEQAINNGGKFVTDYRAVGVYDVGSVVNKINAAEYTENSASGAGIQFY